MHRSQILARIETMPAGGLLVFFLKEAWAALFGALLLIAIIFTAYVELPWLSRYDWLFVFAIAIQGFMLLAKLEKPYEVITIVLFHLVGLGMELFKTSSSIGSWSYPGDAFFQVGNVPLFSGFMYAAVGSYIARAWRVLDLRLSHYPNRAAVGAVGAAIYLNFFTHHFIVDVRYGLFGALLWLYGRTWVTFRLYKKVRRMPLLVALTLIALFIWIAENISTFTRVWLYPEQVGGWQIVSFGKFGSWLLLIVISFILVETLHYLRQKRQNNVQKTRQ